MKQGWLPSDARLKDDYIQMNVVDENGKPSVWRPHNAMVDSLELTFLFELLLLRVSILLL